MERERIKTSALSRLNWLFVVSAILLCAIGLLNLYSAELYWGASNTHRIFLNQLLWVGIGVLSAIFFSFLFDYHLLERMANLIYVVTLVMLILVLLFGKTVAGHRSWLGVGGLGVQPAEFAKLALVIMLSKFFANNPHPEGMTLKELPIPFIYSFLPAALIIFQGDLGSTVFFGLIFFTYVWFGKLRSKTAALMMFAAIALALFFYLFAMSSYQKARIRVFLDPSYDVTGSGYHLTQSKVAVGSGGFMGKGYMHGSVNKLKYLPEKHTDFIFPVFAEEWGFVGSFLLLLIFFIFFMSGLEIAKSARDRFGIFMGIGILGLIFWHVVINIGGVLGIMPLTGVPLPFFSYGGSFTLTLMSSIGILVNASRKRHMF